MTRNITLALDVGGTYIKAAALDAQGAIICGSDGTYPAWSDAPRDVLLHHLYRIIRNVLRHVPSDATVAGIGFSFPGPFDYENGVCLLHGLGKFDALYGVSLRDALRQMIRERGFPLICCAELPILFENDAALFAMGEWAGEPDAHGRRISVTLGTGVGSAFIEEGRLIKQGTGVPENGWIYATPCGDGIIDDQLSARGLVRLAQGMGMAVETPLALANLAREGEEAALHCFVAYGERLGEALRPFTEAFYADELVLGGQIAKSDAFFLPQVQARLPQTRCRRSQALSRSVYLGIHHLLMTHIKEQA